jgi:acyl dehydratase
LQVGERRRSSTRTVSEEEIVAFARLYDPQWFHSDAEAARQSHFGEVIASGIHVLAIWRQLDHEINGDIDFVCGVGFDELRLKNALRAGDTVYVTSEITALQPSRSGHPRGTAMTRYAMINQAGDEVVTFTSINLVYTTERRATS